jgi:hypothetical protein
MKGDEIVILCGFETESSEPYIDSTWDDKDKMSQYMIDYAHTTYTWEAIPMPRNGRGPKVKLR